MAKIALTHPYIKNTAQRSTEETHRRQWSATHNKNTNHCPHQSRISRNLHSAALQVGKYAMIYFVQTYFQLAKYQNIMDYSSQKTVKDCEKQNKMTIL